MVPQRAFAGDGLGEHRDRRVGQFVLVDVVAGQRRRGVLGDGLVVDADHAGVARYQHARRGERLQYADRDRIGGHDERIRHVVAVVLDRLMA